MVERIVTRRQENFAGGERGDPPGIEPARADEAGSAAIEQEDEAPGLVGSLVWHLDRGDRWVLGPECAFLFRDCWREALVREAYMLEQPVSRRRAFRDGLRTLGRRWITGEPFLLDLYTAQKDGAELGISSDEIGGNLYAVQVDRGPLISRKTVYFGSQPDVTLRVSSPLQELRRGLPTRDWLQVLKRTAYGPGWVFQRFELLEGGSEAQIILQIDGDAYFRDLAVGETLRTDPRHVHAWDASVSWRLVEFGSVLDRLLRGSVPFQVEFEGPGRLWLSNISFGDGYLGSLCTPTHWLHSASQVVQRLLGYLNPANWV